MGRFNREDRGSRGDRGGRGGFGGKKSFGGGGRGFDRGDRSERQTMHDAVCSECGRDCEVPFRPTGDKPVYCSSCFGRKEESGGGRFERGGNDRSSNFGEKKMFDAVCDSCGQDCEVPFRPSSDKPVYCSGCFEKVERSDGGDRRDRRDSRNDRGDRNDRGERREKKGGSDQFNKQFEMLNNKLDSLLKILSANASVKTSSEKPVEKIKEEKVVVKETKKVAKEEKPVVKEAKKEVKEEKVAEKEVKVKKVAAKKKEAATEEPKKAAKKAVAKKKK